MDIFIKQIYYNWPPKFVDDKMFSESPGFKVILKRL